MTQFPEGSLARVIETDCGYSIRVGDGGFFCSSKWSTAKEAQAVADIINCHSQKRVDEAVKSLQEINAELCGRLATAQSEVAALKANTEKIFSLLENYKREVYGEADITLMKETTLIFLTG